MSKYIFYNHQTLTDTIDINIYNSYYSFVQNIFLGGIPMISENKLKLGLDINRIHHIISRKMDATVISSIDDNLTVSQAYVIDFIYFSLINFPVFNLADIYVVVSGILLILFVCTKYRDDDFSFLGRKH